MPIMYSHQEFDDHEIVSFFREPKSGLKAIVAVHSTHLGPAGGGVRMQPYASSADAITDVLRLSKGMSYKNALAEIALGGGKAVLFGDPKTNKSPELMHALGDAIQSLGGKYLAAEDVGMTLADMEAIATRTNHVFGRDPKLGFGGEPSPMTALGVFESIKLCVQNELKSDLGGIRVAIQGAGAVGSDLARRLIAAGAKVFISDIDSARAQKVASLYGAQIIGLNDVLGFDCDVLAPCALGAILNSASIKTIKAKIVCGAANNQLASHEDGQTLFDTGIVYAPDYVANAGGIINVSYEVGGNYDAAIVEKHVLKIPQTLAQILDESKAQNKPTNVIADEMARKKIGRS